MLSRLKEWLQYSGVGYISASDDSRFKDYLMNDSINPLSKVIEDPKHPWARIYRTTVFQGISDTYHVLMGNHYDLKLTGQGRMGVLDIFILPLISRRIVYKYHASGKTRAEEKPKDFLKTIFWTMASVPAAMIEVMRGLTAIALTAILSPLVLAVHILAFHKGNKLKNQVRNLNVVVAKEIKNGSTKTIKMTLGKWMDKYGIFSVAQIEYVPAKKYFRKKASANISGWPGIHIFQLAAPTPKTQKALSAFEELNIGKRVRIC